MSIRTRRRWVLFTVAVAVIPSAAFAWGSDGHRAIGEIARHYLSPQAEREVALLLEPGPYDTLAAAGYWADAHARLYRAYDEYLQRHYVNVEPSAEAIDLARDCPEDCVLTAIADLTERLRDRSRPLWQRAQDFRFLVHFVEDVHQPLHVVHPDGRGGNRLQVTLFGEEMNLHSAWDWGLIEHRLETFENRESGDSAGIPVWKEWAYELRTSIDAAEVREWSAQLDPVAWAAEGIQPARELAFDVQSGQALDQTYYDDALPVVERRVRMAAVRLAALLNDIFTDEWLVSRNSSTSRNSGGIRGFEH